MKSLRFLLLLSLISTAHAANKYIRKGATGNGSGSDWTNAYTDFSSLSLSGLSGFTIYIAAGSYTTDFPVFESINNWNLKRATVADHGTSTGWSDSYDGLVTHTGSRFMNIRNSSNILVDGGGTKEPWLFRVVGHNEYNGKLLAEGNTNLTIRYLDMDGNGLNPAEVNGPEDGLRLGGNTNVLLEHNYIHNYYQRTTPPNYGHADGIQMPSVNGCIIRYNKFQDSGMLLFIGDCTWGGQWANNVHVHHNVFIQRAGTLVANESNYRFQDHKGVNQTGTSYLIVENNTYYSQAGSGAITLMLNENTDCPPTTTRRHIRNNIFVNGDFGMTGGYGTSPGFNVFFGGSSFTGTSNLTSNPLFVDAANFNFRLQAGSPAADSGTSTTLGYGDTLTVDYDGNTIGAARSRGAFEPAATGDPLPAIVSATINSAGTQVAIVFSEAVTIGAGGANGWVLNMSGGSITIPSQTPTGSGTTRTYTFSSVRTVGQGETGSIAYTQPGNGIEDSALQDLPNGSTQVVTNSSTVATANAPNFAPVAGSYFGTQNVVMTSSTPGATIRYTIDGSDPTAISTQYTAGATGIPTSISTTYKAKAFASGFLDSSISTISYEIGTWSTVGSAWKSFIVPQQTGTFTWTFRASASAAGTDGVIGLSSVLPDGFNDLGPIIQFNTDNTIKARNGANYEAINAFTYVPGTTYEIVCTINIANRTYSATAAQISGTPVVIANNYAFRSDSPVAPELDNFGMSCLINSVTVSQMSFGGVATIPTLTSATIGANGVTLTLGFSVPVGYGTGGSGGWTINASGGAATLTPTASPTSFTVSRTIGIGETGTINYVQPGNGVEATTGGGDLASVSSFAFNNQSTIDLRAPTPNPMSFSSQPAAASSFSVTMTASVATDANTPPVQYYFDETSANPGGVDSGWQTSRTYTNTGLTPGIQYTYRVLARDSSPALNQTSPSGSVNATTPIIAGGKLITPAKETGAGFLNP